MLGIFKHFKKFAPCLRTKKIEPPSSILAMPLALGSQLSTWPDACQDFGAV